ncbi:MAG TPA: ABC transporter permease [Polyangiaceae bacterium]|nr:ABC transporter permease [Polyangiaceae bacterium]
MMLLAIPAAPKLPVKETWLTTFWNAIGIYGRIGLIFVGVLALVVGVFFGLRWLSRKLGTRVWRMLLLAVVGIAGVGFLGLGTWSHFLPHGKGTPFVLGHQVINVSTVVCGMIFVVGLSALAIPYALDALERGGFMSFVAARHVRATKSGFLTVISVLSIVGVALSALALCVVVAVMGGFGADLKRKILGNNAHVRVEAKKVGGFTDWRDLADDLRKVQGVKAVTPVAGGESMASSASNTAGVLIRGIDPDSIGTVIDLRTNIEVGRFEFLKDTKRLANLPPNEPIGLGPGGEVYLKGPDLKSYTSKLDSELDPSVKDAVREPDEFPGIVIGRELAKSLHVYVGDEITLVSPIGDLGPMGLMPKSRRFRIAAIFYSGMYEYDASQAYVKLDEGQEFLDLKQNITALEIRLDDAERVDAVRPLIEGQLKRDDVRVRDWKELNKNLFSALKLEKIATFVILSLAILVASFCILCTLLLMVTEKSKEIAIMKSLGASDGAILTIFMGEGMLIGAIGTYFGVATGFAAIKGLTLFGLRLDPDVYYVDRLPISADFTDFLLVALSALVITTLATIYPAVAASRLRPVEGIRYE